MSYRPILQRGDQFKSKLACHEDDILIFTHVNEKDGYYHFISIESDGIIKRMSASEKEFSEAYHYFPGMNHSNALDFESRLSALEHRVKYLENNARDCNRPTEVFRPPPGFSVGPGVQVQPSRFSFNPDEQARPSFGNLRPSQVFEHPSTPFTVLSPHGINHVVQMK